MALTKVDAQLLNGAVTADSSGNVGIGATPSAWSTNYGIKALDISNGAVYGSTQDTNLVSNAYFNNSNTWIYKTTNTAAYYNINASGDHRWSTAPSGTAGTALTWTERMRIDSSGGLRINATTYIGNSGEKLTVVGDGDASFYRTTAGNNAGTCFHINRSAGTGNFLYFTYGTGLSPVGSINTNGSNTTYSTSSDYRLKDNISPMLGALDTIAKLKPVTYTWKSTGEESQGFIAHELAEVCPEAVVGEKDAVNEDGSIKPQAIDTSFLVATLTAAIQELKAELDATKAEVTALKAHP